MLFICSALFGCSVPSDDYAEQTITFTVSDTGKTEYNAAIFDIDPFELHFILPKGWTVRETAGDEDSAEQLLYLYSGAFSKVYLFDVDNTCIGAVGYNAYELYEGAKDNPQAICGQIGLGNDYRFDIRKSYTVAASTEEAETACMDVYYSESFMGAYTDNPTEKNNKGILPYDKDRLVYVAFEFEDSSLNEDVWQTIAESMSIQRPEGQ